MLDQTSGPILKERIMYTGSIQQFLGLQLIVEAQTESYKVGRVFVYPANPLLTGGIVPEAIKPEVDQMLKLLGYYDPVYIKNG